MKNIVIVSVLCSLLVVPAFAAQADGDKMSENTPQLRGSQSYEQPGSSSASNLSAGWQAKAEENRGVWEQQRRRFEMSNDTSFKNSWDEYTAAYQRSKKIH
jgi:hypothetical protein